MEEILVATIATVVAASGVVITCVVRLLPLVRDWHSNRRAVKAHAESDEAVRDYYRARAKQASLQTEILAWLFRQAKKGQEEVNKDRLVQVIMSIQSGRIEPAMSEPQAVDLPANIELPIDPRHIGPFSKAS